MFALFIPPFVQFAFFISFSYPANGRAARIARGDPSRPSKGIACADLRLAPRADPRMLFYYIFFIFLSLKGKRVKEIKG